MNSHPRTPMKSLFALTATLPLVLAACNAAENVDPVDVETTTTTSTSTGTGGSGGEGGSPPVTPVRAVEQRNPFGNVAATDNLLWDGDFEWSSPFSDQYGWLFGPPYGYELPAMTIGAACRSGIKCVTLAKNKGIIGIGVGTQQDQLAITVFVKPKTGVCADIDVALITLNALADDAVVPPDSEAPDSTGWCLYRTTVPSYPKKVYLFVDNNTGDEVIVDDAVVRAIMPGASPPPAPAPTTAPPTAQKVARREEARAAISALRGPHVPPPNAARRAFEEHLSK